MERFWTGAFTDGTLWKLLLALILSGLIGLEREWRGRAAGLRTHVLVCLGSTILLVAARGAVEALGSDNAVGRLVLDPNRISAGIVTGIGFLGAGAIIRMGDLVRGLTTAACIWFVAALGVVIGSGMYAHAIISTLLVLLVLLLFDVIEHAIPPPIYRALTVNVSSEMRAEFEAWCCHLLRADGARIQEILHRIDSASGRTELVFQIRARGSLTRGKLTEQISKQPGVLSVRWDHG